MATVQALLVLQARTAIDEEAARQLREAAGRIHTFSAMHEHLYRVGAAAKVDMAAYLRSLIEDQRAVSAPSLAGRHIAFDADPGQWPSADAPGVGMIMFELVTNALKYGKGTVTVTFRQNSDNAVLIVADQGKGLPADFDPAHSSGLGMRIIGGLVRGEGGEIKLDRSAPHTRFVATLKRRRASEQTSGDSPTRKTPS